MLKRLAALFIVLAFAGQTLAGGFACDGGGSDSAAEMACCQLAKSDAGATTAMLCCQLVCGEPTSGGTPGTQSETPSRAQQVPAPAIADIPATPFHSLFAVAAPLSQRSANALLLRLDPPALYLHHSTFLI